MHFLKFVQRSFKDKSDDKRLYRKYYPDWEQTAAIEPPPLNSNLIKALTVLSFTIGNSVLPVIIQHLVNVFALKTHCVHSEQHIIVLAAGHQLS